MCMPLDDEKEITAFVEERRKVRCRRLFGRIYLRAPERAILRCRYAFSVKEISGEGMQADIEEDGIGGLDSYPMEVVLSDGQSLSFAGNIRSCMEAWNGGRPKYQIEVDFDGLTDEQRRVIRGIATTEQYHGGK